MAAKIKSGDLVKVIRGKDRGKEGTVKQVLKDDRLIVEGVQIVKKHARVRIVEKEEARDGKVKTVRVRVAKKSGKELA